MERSLKYCLSTFLLLLIFSCQTKREKAESVYKRATIHYQGSKACHNGIKRAIEIDSTYPQAVYELSVAYLKRGLPHKWKPQYDKAVKLDSVDRIPWRGYLYLWFYRDYKKAIADFDASDILTPDFIDAPQGHSVDYWRGIAYLGLKDYKNSIYYFDKYIAKETKDTGEDWVEMTGFLYCGIAHYENKNDSLALQSINKLLKYTNDTYADGNYYKALILERQGDNQQALELIDLAITNYNDGYYNYRPYVETLRQIYMEDLLLLKKRLTEKKQLKQGITIE